MNDDRLVAHLGDFVSGAAPWVRALGITVEAASPGDVTFRLPGSADLIHAGGVVCGQAIMAGMDLGMVLVMASLPPPSPNASFTTVQLQTTFERAAPAATEWLEYRAIATKNGRTLVFGQIDCFLPDGVRCATATTQFLWLASPEPQ